MSFGKNTNLGESDNTLGAGGGGGRSLASLSSLLLGGIIFLTFGERDLFSL